MSPLPAIRIMLFALLLATGSARAASFPDSAAASHVSQTVTIQGTVSGVHVSDKGTVFINFGPPYPNQDFTAVIFASAAPQFGDVKRFTGRKLSVTGPISVWKGKPETIVRAPSQLHDLK
jgi:hypothetical protein